MMIKSFMIAEYDDDPIKVPIDGSLVMEKWDARVADKVNSLHIPLIGKYVLQERSLDKDPHLWTNKRYQE